jgi:putative oxidoreductase
MTTTTNMNTTTNISQTRTSRPLHIGLWVVQVLLAASFAMAGFTKLTTPIAALGAMMPWTADFPELLVRFIGLSEVLGAVGLIVPALTRIQPKLTGWAAAGLVVMMVLASFVHLSRGEASMLPVNLGLAALAAFVAWGRLKAAPIAPRRA